MGPGPIFLRSEHSSQLWPWYEPSTASGLDDLTEVFEVIHPFHPQCGQQFELLAYRHNWGEHRVMYRDAGGRICSLPAGWTRWGIRHLNDVEGKPAIFYLHPWEIDPDQPRLQGSLVSRFRHYRNLGNTEPRLRRLLEEFAFGPMSELLESREPSKADEAPVARRAG